MILLFLILFLTTSLQAQTPLANLANSMQAGSWGELTTSNISALLQPGSSGNILNYAANASWDPVTQRLLFFGNDHIDGNTSQHYRFVIYDGLSNTWTIKPTPPFDVPGQTNHGYYQNGAINTSSGTFYRRRTFATFTYWKYSIPADVWTQIPDNNVGENFWACCGATSYFPELGGFVHAQGGDWSGGSVYLFTEATSTWSKIATVPTLTGGTSMLGVYNPVHHVFVFGQSGNFYEMDSNRTVTRLNNPPVSFYNGLDLGNIVADPATGDFLFLTLNTKDLWKYSVITDTWQPITTTNKPNLNNWQVIAAPVSNYGVIQYVACYGVTCRVYLYKHASGGTAPPPPPPDPCATPLTFTLTWPTSESGNVTLNYQVNRVAKVTFDPMQAKATAQDNCGQTVVITH